MRIIGIQNLVGGAGATSIVAGYTVALNELGVRAIALDLQEDNQLQLLFGRALSDTNGLATDESASLQDYLYETQAGYPFIPMGLQSLSSPEQQSQLVDKLEQLITPVLTQTDRVLILDVPASKGPLQDWAYRHAELMINVVQPEPRAPGALLRFAADARVRQQAANCESMVLFNGVAPQLELNKDTLDYLRSQLHPSAVIPVMVHRDQHIPEACARAMPVFEYARQAQSSRDFDALALWTLSFMPEIEQVNLQASET